MTYQELSEKEVYQVGSLGKTDLPILPNNQIVGQERAVEALLFHLQLNHPKTHIFCLGAKGVGRTSLTRDIVCQYAATLPSPNDWIYVANFGDLMHPVAIELPTGLAPRLQQDMHHLIDSLQYELSTPTVSLVQSQQGLGLSPVLNHKVLEADEFNKLPLAQRKPILKQLEKDQKNLTQLLQQKTILNPQELLDEFNHQKTINTIQKHWDKFLKKYQSVQNLNDFLNQCYVYLCDNWRQLMGGQSPCWQNLKINVLTTHSKDSGVPVIQLNPMTLNTLLGTIEQRQQAGSLLIDHTMIQAGCLHQANHGFLIIEAKDIQNHPLLWQRLKQALYTHQIKMDSPTQNENVLVMQTLQPTPIPLSIKVILIGDSSVYYDWLQKEEDFNTLFTALVRFEDKFPRTEQMEKKYAGVLADFIVNHHLKPFTLGAMNALLEYSARLAQSQKHLTARLTIVQDLMQQANFISAHSQVEATDVWMAIEYQNTCINVPQREFLDAVSQQTIQMSVQGTQEGQVNALVVHELGAFTFGHPSRITCRVHSGTGKINDVERAVSLGGNIHSKGMMILSSYLSSRYNTTHPKLDATLVWEQTYHGIEGDSASVAELCALMSAIGQIPLRQDLAITGAVNQWGEIQSVGALNVKIEGFFDTCEQLGLTGTQGVIIPTVSQHTLMLNNRVRAAIQSGKFHIYTVQTVDEAMTLLTKQKAPLIHQKIKRAWSQK